MDDSDQESPTGKQYLVEKILDKRVVSGQVYYHLKWQDFGDDYNTWEPHTNLSCPEFISKFEQQWEAKRKTKKEDDRTFLPCFSPLNEDYDDEDEEDEQKLFKNDSGPKRPIRKAALKAMSKLQTYFDDQTRQTQNKISYSDERVKRKMKKAADAENGTDEIGYSKKNKKAEAVAVKKRKVVRFQLPPTKDVSSEVTGFDRRLKAEKILGATDASGELLFLMKWMDSDEADLVPSRLANLKCPQVVIRFYEERLTWTTNPVAVE